MRFLQAKGFLPYAPALALFGAGTVARAGELSAADLRAMRVPAEDAARLAAVFEHARLHGGI